MVTLDRFRIIRLADELQKEFGLHEVICADPDGQPFLEGQTFYGWVIDNACEPATAYNYLCAVLPFLTFLWKGPPSLRYTAPADQIRARVRDYLKEKLGCAVRPHRNGNFMVKPSGSITSTSVRLFLTALRRFYYCAILKRWYADVNPLEWTTRLSAQREFDPKMPPRSGLTLPDDKQGRVPDTYFCLVSHDWQPHIIDDPHLRQLVLPAFARTRDLIITRILFDSGARISEVLKLTMGDWRRLGQCDRAWTIDKGSRGERVKEIWWSFDTAQLLRNYINNERRLSELKGRGLNDLPDSAPIFVTETGKPYTYAAFYANWQKACEKAHLKITPHQVRHWYVTMALHLIESQPDGTKREAYRQSLIAYMGWQNPETIKAYDHHIRKLHFGPIHTVIAQLGDTQGNCAARVNTPEAVSLAGLNVISDDLERLLGQRFGWND